jgi:hypothetical protein
MMTMRLTGLSARSLLSFAMAPASHIYFSPEIGENVDCQYFVSITIAKTLDLADPFLPISRVILVSI